MERRSVLDLLGLKNHCRSVLEKSLQFADIWCGLEGKLEISLLCSGNDDLQITGNSDSPQCPCLLDACLSVVLTLHGWHSNVSFGGCHK